MRGSDPDAMLLETLRVSAARLEGRRILVALSGGSDSVALAALLAELTVKARIASVCLAHISHGVRRSAAQDEAVAVAVAQSLGIPLLVRSPDLAGKRDEASMRNARYGALVDLARQQSCDAVATGHTANDQTETVLLALFRGCGADGFCGIPVTREVAPGIALLRPLLAIDRDRLRRYCERKRLPYAVDPTNADTNYRRNAVRAALSTLRPLFPGLDRTVARSVRLIVDGSSENDGRRRLRTALKKIGTTRNIGFERINAAARFLDRNGSGLIFLREDISVLGDGTGRFRIVKKEQP